MAGHSTPSPPSTGRRVHRLVEEYTPQGTLGRLLLGLSAFGVSPVLVFGGLSGMTPTGAVALLPFVAGLLALVGGVAALVVGVVTLWPVYLSLIGNVESPADYPVGAAGRRRSGREPTDADPDDAEELLKRRYAAGDLSREEFERRLDAILDAGDRRPDRGRDGKLERERE